MLEGLGQDFWIGAGGGLLGTLGAAIVALLSIYLTRRSDRRTNKERESYAAATRILDSLVSISSLIEVPLRNTDDYGEWIRTYLEQSAKHRKVVLIDAPSLIPQDLRDAVIEDADWLGDGFVSELGRVELRYQGNSPGEAMDRVKAETHKRIMATTRRLMNWRATGKQSKSPLSAYTQAKIAAKPPGIWDSLSSKSDDRQPKDSREVSADRSLAPKELTFMNELKKLMPNINTYPTVDDEGRPWLFINRSVSPNGTGVVAVFGLDFDIEMLNSYPDGSTYTMYETAERAWAVVVTDWFDDQAHTWNRSAASL